MTAALASTAIVRALPCGEDDEPGICIAPSNPSAPPAEHVVDSR